MKRTIYYLIVMTLSISACQLTGVVNNNSSTTGLSSTLPITSTKFAVTATSITLTPQETNHINTPSPNPNPKSSLTLTPPLAIKPVIHEQSGQIYQTIFTLPVGEGETIQYFGSGDAEINGPNALVVLPDGSFMIANPVSNCLLHYDSNGKWLKTLELIDFGIKNVVDLRAKGGELYLLENGTGPDPQIYWIRHLSSDGHLVASDKIPYHYPVGDDLMLENTLTGIDIDCEGNIILELTDGSDLYRLSDIKSQPDLTAVTNGYYCNGKLYRVINPGLGQIPKIIAGDITYETKLTTGLGGLRLLGVFRDDSFYIVRNDVVNSQVINVDQTIHYIGRDGAIWGIARVPLSEFNYYVMRSTAIGANGEVYVLLPRPDSLDIIKLNFYRKLEPLIPSAINPQITMNRNN